MLKSMTGYGLAKGQEDNLSVHVELRSLNSKFMDSNVRLPKIIQDRELDIRNMLSSQLTRGKVSLNVELRSEATEEEKVFVNRTLFKAYYKEFSSLADEVNANQSDLFRLALHSPEVLLTNNLEEDGEREWAVVKRFLTEAIQKCDEFRTQEGAVLEKELSQYIDHIQNYLEEIRGLEGKRTELIKERIHNRMLEIQEADEFDKNRFEQEMVYYIEKLDISEELVRLQNHLNYFKEVAAMKTSQGKKLGFISQEIGREINTIGSKANFAEVQRHVVCMKDELEKIKEQLLNVL